MSILTAEQEKKILEQFDIEFVVPDTVKKGVSLWDEATPDNLKSFLLSTIEACLKEDREKREIKSEIRNAKCSVLLQGGDCPKKWTSAIVCDCLRSGYCFYNYR